jgi:multidrug resistance efflux pump
MLSSHRRILAFLLSVLPLALAGCTDKVEAEPTIRPIRALRVGEARELTGRTFPGTVEAVEAVELSFRVGGPLVAYPAQVLGKEVVQGELLAQIDARDFQIRLQDTEAALAKANSELDAMRKARPEEIEQLKASLEHAEASAQFAAAELARSVQLIQREAITTGELELNQARARMAQATVLQAKEELRIGEEGARPEDIRAKQSQILSLEAAVQTARDALADTRLLAPFAGSVAATYVENFEVVQPNQRIVRLVNTSEFEIRVDIPETLIALVPAVTTAFVTLQTSPDVPIPARIVEVGTEASSVTRTYPVKLRFVPPEGIEVRAGMSASVQGQGEVSPGEEPAGRTVPATAVFERDGKQQVWLYDPSSKEVKLQAVSVLTTTPLGLTVSGIKPGDWIVTAGVHYLKENQQVRLIDGEAKG